jgi:NAD(P)-dependent dehydrogenase (short-subunit alcohol dehydrogenase family)
MGLLDGKVAIITGAGGGLGRSYALLLAKEGAAILVNDFGASKDGTGPGTSQAALRVAEEIVAAGGRAAANGSDVGTAEGGRQILDDALAAFGRVDILINNAGILRDKSFAKLEEADWDAVVKVHLKGAYCVARPVFQWMKENGHGGVIVNTASSSGLAGSFGQANYAAAKMGVVGLSSTLAIEGKKFGIRVWTIAPAAATRLVGDLISDDMKAKWAPDHVAPVMLYMVSSLSGGQTGKILFASGTRIKEIKLVGAEGLDNGAGMTATDIAAAADKIFLPESSLSFD